MDVNFTALIPSPADELNCVVKDTGDVLAYVIFQVVGLVLNPLINQVILAKIGSAVHNVGNANF